MILFSLLTPQPHTLVYHQRKKMEMAELVAHQEKKTHLYQRSNRTVVQPVTYILQILFPLQAQGFHQSLKGKLQGRQNVNLNSFLEDWYGEENGKPAMKLEISHEEVWHMVAGSQIGKGRALENKEAAEKANSSIFGLANI